MSRLRHSTAVIILMISLSLIFIETARAVEFVIVGPRAAGMGGAGVAVTTDALATYWNPAGLAMERSVDIRLQGSAQVTDRLGVLDALEEIDAIDTSDTSMANQARLQALLDRLNRQGASVSGAAAGGLYFKGYWGNHHFGVNVSDVATAGSFVSSPLTAGTSGGSLVVNGTMALPALEARQVGFSYAYAFADQTFALGVTGKVIQGAAYSGRVNVLSADGKVDWSSDLGKANTSADFGIDVGALVRPTSWLRVGIVGKDLNEPAFDAPGGATYRLNPQVRGGIAANPYSSLTLTVDGDILTNKTLIPGIKSRVVSVGAEQTLFSDVLALRVGALTNTKNDDESITYTAGLGIRIMTFRLDLGGGYDFKEREALVSGSISMTF